jgi:hypothetical protein
MEISNLKFQVYPSSWRWAEMCSQTHRWAIRYTDRGTACLNIWPNFTRKENFLWRFEIVSNSKITSCRDPTFLYDFNKIWNFLYRISQKSPVWNFAKLHPLRSAPVHMDWKTKGIRRIIGDGRDNANASKNFFERRKSVTVAACNDNDIKKNPFFMWRWGPIRAMTSFTRFLDQTQRSSAVYRTPLEGWSAQHWDL